MKLLLVAFLLWVVGFGYLGYWATDTAFQAREPHMELVGLPFHGQPADPCRAARASF